MWLLYNSVHSKSGMIYGWLFIRGQGSLRLFWGMHREALKCMFAVVTEEGSCAPEIFYIYFYVFIRFYPKVEIC